ncbi:hypothetical protein J2755_001298 [Methanohalophilus levihalophilus]|uniref:hypothetical protein n=1 Tax=Methanohalophilus levihalophilus TaxID=1431282 RepID=UPI001AEA39D2|nr:hypothetical protein [Methanohalophilus levihalophilus]MBP2030364.1 hypothetical protein [Methanohalophilus levihalophilus]
MVKVQVNVKNLAIDLDGKEMKFRQGDMFEIPAERAEMMGNTLVVLEDERTPKRKTAGK